RRFERRAAHSATTHQAAGTRPPRCPSLQLQALDLESPLLTVPASTPLRPPADTPPVATTPVVAPLSPVVPPLLTVVPPLPAAPALPLSPRPPEPASGATGAVLGGMPNLPSLS